MQDNIEISLAAALEVFMLPVQAGAYPDSHHLLAKDGLR